MRYLIHPKKNAFRLDYQRLPMKIHFTMYRKKMFHFLIIPHHRSARLSFPYRNRRAGRSLRSLLLLPCSPLGNRDTALPDANASSSANLPTTTLFYGPWTIIALLSFLFRINDSNSGGMYRRREYFICPGGNPLSFLQL